MIVRYLLTLALCLFSLPAMAGIRHGVNGQPMAVVFGRDRDMATSPFSTGTHVYQTRIPVSITAANGDKLCFVEMRDASQDYSSRGFGYKRSTNGGITWGPLVTTANLFRSDFARAAGGWKWQSLGSAVVNDNGRIILLFTRSDSTANPGPPTDQVSTLWETHSDDHGTTWSAPAEITTGLKKVSNADPANLPACYDNADAAWGWCMFGPEEGVCTATGRLVIPCNHRYTTDQSGIGWSHCVISDDDGATWYLGGGFHEADATDTNDYTNELSFGLLSNGNIYANCRFASGANANKRGQVIITDPTVQWSNVSLMTDGTNTIDSNSCQGAVLVASDGDVYVSCVNDSSLRSRVTVFRSTDGGTTFPQKNVVNYGYSGYSHLWEIEDGQFGIIYEATDDLSNANGTDAMASAQFIRMARFTEDWVTAATPAVVDWWFNDGVAGQATNTAANEVGTWSGFAPHGKGGANMSWHADGLAAAGSGAGVKLMEAQDGSGGGIFDCSPTEDITIEVEFKVSSAIAANAGILDSKTGTTTQGFSIIALSNKKIGMHMYASANVVKSSTATLADDAWHTAALVWDRGVGMKGYIDGVEDTSFAYTDAQTSTTPITSVSGMVCGSYNNGLSPLPASSYVRRVRVTRSAKTSGFMLAGESKPSLTSLTGYRPVTPLTLPSTANLKLAMFAPFIGAQGGYGWTDRFGGSSLAYNPPARGTPCLAYRESSPLGRLFLGGSAFRGGNWDTDSAFGSALHYRNSFTAGDATTGSYFTRAANADLDFIQTTATFTIIMAICPVADTYTANQVYVDNITASGAGNGFSIFRNTGTNDLSLAIGRGGALRYNEALSGALTNGTWYCVAWVGQGSSAKVRCYKAAYTAGVLASLGAGSDSTATMDATPGGASTGALTIGVRNDIARTGNAKYGPILIFNDDLDAATISSWASFFNQDPTFQKGTKGGRLRTGIGIGL